MIKLKSRFGLWRVLKDNGRLVAVVCRCGKKANVFRYNLTRGLSTGCASCSNRRTKPRPLKSRYGRWKVIEATAKRELNGGVMVRCVCDCGRESLVRATMLRCGRSSACKSCAARDR